MADRRPSCYHLFWIFVICSVVGLFVETVVSYPIDGVWKDRAGLVWGPFSPIYGLGGVIVTLALYRFRNSHSALVFALSAAIGAAFEFVAGWFFQSAFGIVAWDYSDHFLNLGGHTCFGIALVWGVVGLLWVKCLMGVVVWLADLIPQRARGPVTIVLAVFMAVGICVTLLSFNFWYLRTCGQVPAGTVASFFDRYFGNDFMESRFQTITVFSDLASR